MSRFLVCLPLEVVPLGKGPSGDEGKGTLEIMELRRRAAPGRGPFLFRKGPVNQGKGGTLTGKGGRTEGHRIKQIKQIRTPDMM